jgi:hypothetical protein
VTGFRPFARATFVRTSKSIPETKRYPPGLTRRALLRRHLSAAIGFHVAEKPVCHHDVLIAQNTDEFRQMVPSLSHGLTFTRSSSTSNMASISSSVRRSKIDFF